jgi:U3 small nucleolar RNA-associated protein 20
MLAVIGQWVAAREENPALAGAAMAVFGLLIDEEVDVDELLDMLRPIIEGSAQLLTRAEAGEDASFDHSLPLQAISTVAKAVRAHPSTADRVPWRAIVSHLLFPHDWVRFASARALTVLFAANQETASAFDVLEEEDLLELAKKSCLLLKGSKTSDGEARVVDGKLADQLVKLLWNVSKHWAVSRVLL